MAHNYGPLEHELTGGAMGEQSDIDMHFPTWRTRDGRAVLIKEMSDSHLENTIRFLVRNRVDALIYLRCQGEAAVKTGAMRHAMRVAKRIPDDLSDAAYDAVMHEIDNEESSARRSLRRTLEKHLAELEELGSPAKEFPTLCREAAKRGLEVLAELNLDGEGRVLS